jgi:hypothetical protein
MPGFVDVSNMTSEEVRRMGHADDCDDVDFRPRGKSYASKKPVGTKFTMSDVWAAACAAQRVNGSYVKEPVVVYNESTQSNTVIKRRNRDIMMEFLQDPTRLVVDDIERGEQCRQFLQNDLTFRTLKGKVTDFDTAVKKVLAVQDLFDSYTHKYELAIVACLPASVERTESRQSADERLQFASGGLIGKVGDKISSNIEVVGAVYSQQYGIHWIRAITDQNQAVSFSNKQKFDVGTHLTIQGKVKAHRDNLTQLNYVKVL